MTIQTTIVVIGALRVKLEQKWATSWQNQQNNMCTHRRLRSAWVSTQSDLSVATCWLHTKDSDQTEWMPRLIWVFTGMCTHGRLRSAWVSTQSDQFLLSVWRKFGSVATCWLHSKDSDQTGWMPRLIWVCWHTSILLVLSWAGSNM